MSDYIGRKNTYYTFFLLGIAMYLADVFGTQFVGAIHGRLLTAWSTAGIVGPVVVNYIREFEIAAGVPRDHVYDVTLYVLAAMLVGGFVYNHLVRPLADKWFMKPEEGGCAARRARRRWHNGGRVVWHRQGWAGCNGGAVLGFRRSTAGLGRVTDAGECDEDFLTRSDPNLTLKHLGNGANLSTFRECDSVRSNVVRDW